MQQQEPTRHDLEFMARMLGIIVLRAPVSPTPNLAAAVEFAMADPIANARAQRRISDLLMQCEQVERSAASVLSGDPDSIQRRIERAQLAYPDIN